jgi:hypothetical protein
MTDNGPLFKNTDAEEAEYAPEQEPEGTLADRKANIEDGDRGNRRPGIVIPAAAAGAMAGGLQSGGGGPQGGAPALGAVVAGEALAGDLPPERDATVRGNRESNDT